LIELNSSAAGAELLSSINVEFYRLYHYLCLLLIELNSSAAGAGNHQHGRSSDHLITTTSSSTTLSTSHDRDDRDDDDEDDDDEDKHNDIDHDKDRRELTTAATVQSFNFDGIVNICLYVMYG